MPEKMKGVLAQLITTTKEGTRIDSRIVFRPYCDWWIKPLHDYLGETQYTDFEDVIKEFGLEVAQKIVDGGIVEVVREPPEHLELRGCRRPEKYIRVTYETNRGYTEDLINENTARKLGYQVSKED